MDRNGDHHVKKTKPNVGRQGSHVSSIEKRPNSREEADKAGKGQGEGSERRERNRRECGCDQALMETCLDMAQ